MYIYKTFTLVVCIIHSFGLVANLNIRKNWKNQNLVLAYLSVNVDTAYHIMRAPKFYLYIINPNVPWRFFRKLPIPYKLANVLVYFSGNNYVFLMFWLTVDRLIAALKPMQYKQLFTKKRCNCAVILSFLASPVILVFMHVLHLERLDISYLYDIIELVFRILYTILCYIISSDSLK